MEKQTPIGNKYFYIMNLDGNVITHGPMKSKEVDEMLKNKFHENPKFVKMTSKVKHGPGDVVFPND